MGIGDILNSLGVGNLFGGFNLDAILAWGGLIILAIVILIGASAIVFFRYYGKLKEKQYKNKIPIFLRVGIKLYRTDVDSAKEVFIPDSNISFFFLKKHKIYIARPTRSMGKDEYWYYINTQNGEWVNFDITTDLEHDALVDTNYDHRDTRYSYVNMKEIIKRNYRDKSQPWWKDPVIMTTIAFVIISIVFLGGVWFITAKLGQVIAQQTPIAEKFVEVADKLQRSAELLQNVGSGVRAG